MDDVRAELARVDANEHEAPIDITLGTTVPLAMPDLIWQNYAGVPMKMKLSNTGYTVTVSGKFDGSPPTICGGPLDGSYKFSQMHFHWGPHDAEGSEHTFEGRSVPLEMHIVHLNQKYRTPEEALLQKDGVAIMTVPFISGDKHAGLEGIVRGLAEVTKPHTSFKITPQSLTSLCPPFQRDYFYYWGSVTSTSCTHLIQWLVSRDPAQASPGQFDAFRKLLNVNEEPLLRNYRDTQALKGRTVFHLAPGARDGFTLNCDPEKTSAEAGSRPRAEPSHEASVLSVERPCTSLEQAESVGGFAPVFDEGGAVQRTDSGRELVTTASGRLMTRTPSGRLLQKTESDRVIERTASGHLIEVTPAEEAPVADVISRREPAGRTPSGHLLELTPSGRLVERTVSGRELEHTPSGRLVQRTPSGNLVETTRTPGSAEQPGHLMTAMPGDAEVSRDDWGPPSYLTDSGHKLERTPSGHFAERVMAEPLQTIFTDDEPSILRERGGGSRPRTPSPSSHLRSMSSRAVSFSQLPGPIQQRSPDAWPDAPYSGSATASPVFLDTEQAVRLPCAPLQFLGHFQAGVGLLLTNSGETVEISLLKATERPVLQGGPLQGRYILDSAHFHWLPNDDATCGTHTINNSRSEIECHLVHVHENYRSKTEAMGHPNGLAVVSILHQVGGAECEAFQRLCRELPRIHELNTQVEVPGSDLAYMASVVKPHHYFLYPGRFFGRDDGKAFPWIVFAQPIGICCQNVAAFQSLKLSLEFKQHNTYPMGDRPLFAVIPEDDGTVAAQTGVEEELTVGDLRRTASGRVHSLAPDEWPNRPFESKVAGGARLMAPIDIETSAVPSVPMPPLEYRGHFPADAVAVELRNTGEAVDMTWKDGSTVPTLVGGPLSDEYVFDSSHFHWPQNVEDVGAMHRINGKRCDLEFHMVHFKKSLKTRQEAMFAPEGLAVTSFLINVGGQEDASFAQLIDALPSIEEVEASTDLSIKMDWLKQRAGPHGFVTYPGTLFGADLGINVIWIVYPTPVKICCQQVKSFYKLRCLATDRVHPLHQLLDRPIFHSINPDNCVR